MGKTFWSIFSTFLLIGLFTLSIISFVAVFQKDNNVSDTILHDQRINNTAGQLTSDLSSFRNRTQSQKESFESDDPQEGFGSLLLFTIISGGKVFTGMIMSVYNIIIVLPSSILNVPEVVISVISALLLVGIILALWKVYKLGG